MPKWTITIESDDPYDKDYIEEDAGKEIAIVIDEGGPKQWSVVVHDENGRQLAAFRNGR